MLKKIKNFTINFGSQHPAAHVVLQALAFKPYPFVNRNWELKNVTSIDFSDGFGTPVQLFLKNNQIIKVLPGYEEATYKTNWISDKTRFSFDGMFSPERIIYSFLNKNRKESSVNLS